MNLEQCLLPVSAQDPCGPDLEYDPEFLALEQAVRPQPGQEFRRGDGATIAVEAAETQWPKVLEQAQALLARTKDLRVALLLVRALLHQEGYAGIASGMALLRRLLQDYWEGIHPRLEPDDADPTMRLNALAALNATDSVLGDIRSSFVVDSRQHGRLRVRDIETAQGRLEPPPGESKLSATELAGLLDAALSQSPELTGQSAAALQDLDAMTDWLAQRVGDASLPDLSDLRDMLQLVATALDRGALGQSEQAQGRAAGNSPSGLAQKYQDGPATAILGSIDCRDDVVKSLEILCQYLERNEPTNPVQILLRRAQRMMNMNFLELMQDMAPDGLDQAEKVVGQKIANGDD